VSYRDRTFDAVALFREDYGQCLSLLRETWQDALQAEAWENALFAGGTLYMMLSRGSGYEAEAARVARALVRDALIARDPATQWLLLSLAEAERRCLRRGPAKRAYRLAMIVARRKGDPDIAAVARCGLRELESDDCLMGPKFRERRIPARFDDSTGVTDLETMLRTARRQRAWVVEESLLRALVKATTGNVLGARPRAALSITPIVHIPGRVGAAHGSNARRPFRLERREAAGNAPRRPPSEGRCRESACGVGPA
jgi:hypothetical protein